jgi:ABC-type polysaccharide/polyol phosphate export permease
MSSKLDDPRIERMHRGDRLWAIVAILVLWLTVLFVFYEILDDAGSGAIIAALVISGGMVLLFNSASIVALLKHYSDDKRHLYGLDLYYLDEMKRGRL